VPHRLLSLDLNTNVGHARLIRGQPPLLNTLILRGSVHQKLGEFDRWLNAQFDFDAMAWERPLIMPTDTVQLLELLYGLVGLCHAYAYRSQLRWVEVTVQEAKLALTGYADATKDEMLIAARDVMDWNPANDHEADAGAVGLVAYEQLWPVARPPVRGSLL
jgi:Holliday junction resolvasome RuvABC endonuclease subunit